MKTRIAKKIVKRVWNYRYDGQDIETIPYNRYKFEKAMLVHSKGNGTDTTHFFTDCIYSGRTVHEPFR